MCQSEDAENWEKVLNEHGSVCMEDNWEKVLNEHGSVCMEDNCDTCCICGCEDNEELDDLVSWPLHVFAIGAFGWSYRFCCL